MGRKKEIVEVDGVAVEVVGVEEAFREGAMQQGEADSVEEGLNPEMESGADETRDMADDEDNIGDDMLADFMEEEDVPKEVAAEKAITAKPKRSPRKKKSASDKAEGEVEALKEQSDTEIGVQPETEAQPEEEPLMDSSLSTDKNDFELPEDFSATDADHEDVDYDDDTLELDSENLEDADEWEAYSGKEGESIEGDSEETAVEETADETLVVGKTEASSDSISEKRQADPATRRAAGGKRAGAPVLTLEARGEVETEESREDVIWHEIHNAYRTRRLLTGQLGGIEQTDNGKTIAIVDYKGFRIVIPLKEMMINVGRNPSGQEYAELMLRQNKILGNMLGAEIDFIVKGIDSKARSVVASRRDAMLKKRQIFYLDTDASGMYRVHEGRIVQARVIAVAEKVLRVEVFGVECSIMARDLAWDWIGDAHERFSVGDQVLVRVLSVRREGLEEIAVKADIKSVSQNTSHDNLKKCRIQSKYAGKVTDVHKGVVYIRLSNGVNAVAHSCFDYRTPGKKDDVSFAVTRLDEERGVAVGIITRVIRRNL